MFLSVRKKIRRGDKRWLVYVEASERPQLDEVRTMDWYMNPYAPDAGDVNCTVETLDQAFDELPVPDPEKNEYCLLAVDLLTEPEYVARLPDGWKLLGYDVSDETRTSSLHNCGSWKGLLEPLVHRLNEFGLLSLADAELARKLLPMEWGENMDHAHVTIWALYERQQ
jgi:hypothetical protein